MSNMLLEDVLTVLESVGSVTLRRGKNDVSATPGHVPPKWTCEVSLAGYNNSGGTVAIVRVGGENALATAKACLAEVEAYLSGPKSEEDRLRYTQGHATQIALHAQAKSWENARHPGPLHPRAKISYE